MALIPCAALLAGCDRFVPLSDKGYFHDLIYGNPNKRNWYCAGQCPPEVRAIEEREDARHLIENDRIRKRRGA